MTLLKASVDLFSITSGERRFVKINLDETTFGRIRPSPSRYDIRPNMSNTATYMYKTVSKRGCFPNHFE